MATTLDAFTGQTVTDPVIKESLPTDTAAPDPAFMANVLGPNPWDVDDQQRDEAEAMRRGEAQAKLDRVALDPDSYFKGKDLGFAGDPQKSQVLALNSAFMELASGDMPVPLGESDLQRRLIRQDIAIRRFGGRGADSEESFHAEIVKEAQGRKDQREVHMNLLEAASTAAIVGGVGEKTTSFQAWREEAMQKPGYQAANDADYFEAWHAVQRAEQERIEPFRDELAAVWQAMKGGGAGSPSTILKELLPFASVDGNDLVDELQKKDAGAVAFGFYKSLEDEEERADFIGGLRVLVKTFPENERPAIIANLAKSGGRMVDDLARGAVSRFSVNGIEEALNRQMAGSVGPFSPSDEDKAKAAVNADRIQTDRLAQKNFVDAVRNIEREEFSPVRHFSAPSKDVFSMRTLEDGIYGTPGVLASVGTVLIPGVGPSAMYLAMEDFAYRDMRDNLKRDGMSEAEASQFANRYKSVVAIPQTALEVIQTYAPMGKIPAVNRAMAQFGDAIKNRLLRGGVKAGAFGAAETLTEEGQFLTPYAVQEIAAVFQEAMPDVKWTGEGGAFDGFWTRQATVFISMLPLAAGGAVGGLNREARQAAFKASSTTMKQALGMTAQGIAGIEAAKGPAALNAAIDEAWTTRDPNSEEAAAAVGQLKLQQENQRTATEQLAELGYAAPSFVQSKEGIFVFDGDGKELGVAPDLSGALRIAKAHTTALDNLEADQIAALGSLMEAAKAAVDLDPDSTVEVNLGQFDPEQATPEMAARFAAQVALKEQAEGGTGDIARSVLGYSVTSFAQGMRETVNKLFRGAAVTDAFHETFHGLRRKALKAGTLTRADEISLLRALDTIFQGKTTKEGTQLRFIPERITDEQLANGLVPADLIPADFKGTPAQYAETLLDEAFSEIAEMELLRTRKGKGKGKLGLTRGVISRNLSALAKLIPGVAGKWQAFMQAVRARWGLSLSRAIAMKKAERDGTFDKEGYDAYLDKILGLDQQTEHDAGVKSEFDRILGLPDELADDDIPFSIGSGKDMSHLNALEVGLSRARDYLRNAKSESEKKIRELNISQYEKEIADERNFLGIDAPQDVNLSDDDLLAALMGDDIPFSIGRSTVTPSPATRTFQGAEGSPSVIGPASFSIGDYQGDHTPAMRDSGAPGHDLADIYPEDIYSADGALFYGHGESYDQESINVIRAMRGKPNHKVKIYRAVPKHEGEAAPAEIKKLKADLASKQRMAAASPHLWKDEFFKKQIAEIEGQLPAETDYTINAGDWVTISRSYAKEHGEGRLQGDYKILTKTVSASNIYTEGNSIHEWGFDPSGEGSASFSIAAFHGTPHQVDKFSTDKIGTGEGAQAYGWGLYFAGARAVGEEYAKTLGSEGYNILGTFDGKPVRQSDSLPPEDLMDSKDWGVFLRIASRGKEAAIRSIQDMDVSDEVKQDGIARVNRLAERVGPPTVGNLYTVTLKVENEDLLDWDKPVTEQSPKVIQRLKDAGIYAEKTPYGARAEGQYVYHSEDTSQRLKSIRLKEAGIRGIRYLDGNSRSDGEGSYNYVIFDAADIEIVEENGKPVNLGESSFSIGGMKAANWAEYQSQGRAFTGADGKPRFEMDASQAAFMPSGINDPAHRNGFKRLGAASPIRWLVPDGMDTPLGNILGFDELYENYPQLAGLKVNLHHGDPSTFGSFARVEINGKFSPGFSTIYLSDKLNAGQAFSTLLHEVQHAIQQIEGFAPGSSPEAETKEYNRLRARLNGIHKSDEMREYERKTEEVFQKYDRDEITAEEMYAMIETLGKSDSAYKELTQVTEELQRMSHGTGEFNAHRAYRNRLGEKEARGVQARMKMTAEQRAASPFMDSWGSFSLGPAKVAGILSDNALARITDPRRRTQVMSRIARDFNAMRLQIDRISSLSGFRRSKADMRAEAAAREDMRAEELIADVHRRFGEIMADDDLVKIKQQPVHAFLADPSSPLRGRLKSKAAAIREHPEMFQLHRAGDYDGSDGVSRSVFGGTRMPDQAAQELFDNGLISEPTADAMWEALLAEQKTVAGMKELLEKAKGQIREAKAQAKQEATEWLATQGKDQEVNFSDKEEIRRSLRMLDAILLALPAEIRGKIGGYTQISMITTDAARLAYLKDKLAKADKELETFMRIQYAAEWEALLKKAAPAQNEPGQRPTGSIAADAYDIFRIAEAAMGMSFRDGEIAADGFDAIADHPDTEPHEADVARVKAQMIRLTMNWTAADAARREQAVLEGEKIYFDGLAALRKDASRRRERLGQLRSSAITGTGKTGGRMEREAAIRKAKRGTAREALQMAWEFLSFGQVVNVLFGEDSAAARWFNARELAASNAFEDAFQAKANAIEALFVTLAGSRFTGEVLKNKMTTELTIKVKDALGMDHEFTDSQAITFLLMWRQEDGQRHMRGMVDEETQQVISEWAWDDAAAASIEAQLSPAGHAAMAFLGQSYGEEYGRINDVFRRIWNVSMPRHKMYSPLSVAPAQGKADTIMDPVSGDTMGAGMTPGSLKNRSFSAIAEPLFKDAFQVYVSHARQMEHFIAYGEFARDALAVVNRRETRNAIEAAGGPFAAGVLSKWLDFFAVGGVKDANMGGATARTIGGVIGRLSQAALVGRISVLAMQSLQLTAAAYQMPVGAFLKRLAKLKFGGLAWGDAIRSPYIQRRIAIMPPIVRDAVQGLASGTPNRAKFYAAELGKTISGADALFTGGTYAIFYDYHLGLATQAGLPDPAAHAHSEAERLTDQVAQPVRTGARSWLEVANQGNPAFRAMWNFSSDPRQKIALAVYAAMRRDKAGAEKAAALGKALTITWIGSGVLAALLRAAMRDIRSDDDDEWLDERHWNPKRLGLMALTGPLGGMPYLGEIIENTSYKATGEYMPAGGMLAGIGQSVSVIPKWFEGDFDLLKDAEKIFTDGAAVSSTSGAAASAMHLLRDAWGIIENLEGPD